MERRVTTTFSCFLLCIDSSKIPIACLACLSLSYLPCTAAYIRRICRRRANKPIRCDAKCFILYPQLSRSYPFAFSFRSSFQHQHHHWSNLFDENWAPCRSYVLFLRLPRSRSHARASASLSHRFHLYACCVHPSQPYTSSIVRVNILHVFIL